MAGIVQKGSTKYRLNNKELEAFNAATNEWYRITTLLNPKELILQDGKLGYIGTDGKIYLENWDGTGFCPVKEKTEKKPSKKEDVNYSDESYTTTYRSNSDREESSFKDSWAWKLFKWFFIWPCKALWWPIKMILKAIWWCIKLPFKMVFK